MTRSTRRTLNLAWIALLLPLSVLSDQNDSRLDELFDTLKSIEDPMVEQQTVASIWTIWFESGQEDLDELMEQGNEAMRTGRLETAEQIFTSVIEAAPEFAEGWNRRATVRYYREDFTGSLADIESTLALEPRHFGALWGKGMIMGLQRKFKESIAAFERMMEIAPNSLEARRRLEILREEMSSSAI